jgi:hypothetical protein
MRLTWELNRTPKKREILKILQGNINNDWKERERKDEWGKGGKGWFKRFTLMHKHYAQFQIFRKLSHDPVHTAIPSSVTPKQETRLSWPANTPSYIMCQFIWGIPYFFKLTCSFLSHWIPNVTIEIIIASKEQPARFGECNTCNTWMEKHLP